MKKLCAGVVVAIALALLQGCGGSSRAVAGPDLGPPVLQITLEGHPGPQSVGVLMAIDHGFFADRGLVVDLQEPVSPQRPVTYVVGGLADVSISHEPQVLISRANGAPIAAFGSLVPQPTAAMIWLPKSGIEDIRDLKGKTIAIAGLPAERALLREILAGAGLKPSDVEVKVVHYNLVPSLISGHADAAFGGSWNMEGVALEAKGLHPVIAKVQDLGIPEYEELLLITRQDRLRSEPGVMGDFAAAVARGNAAAVADPEAAVRSILEWNPAADRAVTERQLEATLPLLSRTGRMDPRLRNGLTAWMEEKSLLHGK